MAVMEDKDLPMRVLEMLPDPEPRPPGNKFALQVNKPYIPEGSKEAVIKAIEQGTISSATNVVDELEKELCDYYGVPFAIACSNGYSALVMSLKLACIQAGDDVLIPSFTMAAVVNAVLTVGANPIFVDCEKGKLNPSPDDYKKRLTGTSSGLITTHTYGIPADCLALQTFCKANNLIFIEDIAQAIGTDYNNQLVGTFGDFACASLYMNKTITSGDGGFVLSTRRDDKLRQRAKTYANHGFSQNYRFVHFELSGNYKMSGLQAAFVKPAVTKIKEVMEDRHRIAIAYRKQLDGCPGVIPIQPNPYGLDAPWMFGVLLESKSVRQVVRCCLADAGIETRNYFFPLHLQPLIIKTNKNVETLPYSEELGTRGMYLPTFYGTTEAQICEVCKAIRDAVDKS